MKVKKLGEWQRPAGITLKEMVDALSWYGVEVSFDALRQTVHQLDVPARKDRGPSGRGQAAYYDYEALWMLATAYSRVAKPKSKLENIAAELKSMELSAPEPYSIHEILEEEYSEPERDPRVVREIYLDFSTDQAGGIDLRVLDGVASRHWSEAGLDEPRIASRLTHYKRQALERLGVPAEIAETVGLPERSTTKGGDA